jgi:tetratricopeptide (TPR) repeat protein
VSAAGADRVLEIRRCLNGFRWTEAEDLARAFVAAHPDGADAHVLLGDVLRETWRLDEARAAFERARALDASHADAWAGLGFIHIVSSRTDEGLANCRWAMHLRSDLAAPHRYMAWALLASGQFTRGAEEALEARRLAPLQPENTIVLAAAWARVGLSSGALRLIDRVIRDHPGRAEAWVTRASFRVAQGDLPGATSDLEQGLTLKPRLPPAHALSAHLAAGAGNWTEALAAIARAREGNPASLEYLLLEARWLAARGDRAAALDRLQGEAWRHPRSRELRAQIAMWLLDAGRVDEARRLTSGVRGDAAARAIWRRLADIWIELGADTDPFALQCALAASTGGAEADPSLRLLTGELFGRLGRPAEALRALDGLDTPAAAVLAADQLVRLERMPDAVERLTLAAEAHPSDGLCHMRLGMLLRVDRQIDRAEVSLRRAVELAPEEPAAHEQLGVLLSDQGNLEEALKSFRTAAELSRGATTARLNIGVLFARQKRWFEAEQIFGQIARAEPLHIGALGKLGHVLVGQKRHAEAIEIFEPAIERAPHDVGLRHSLIAALRSLHQTDAAVDAARQWTQDAPDSFSAWSSLARQLAAAQHGDDAAAAADRAWALDPGSLGAIEMRADVASQLGRYHEALEWLDRGLAIEPEHAGLLSAKAFVLQDVAPLSEAAPIMERVLTLSPDAPGSRMNVALVTLRQGRFTEGWDYYESRDSAMRGERSLLAAQTRGGGTIDLSGRSVFVRAEQGLGDTLQFMRYVRHLARDAREVLFQVPDGLVWAAKGLADNLRVFGYRERVPAADLDAALISLPKYYGTTLASIPPDVPYLQADPSRAAHWRARLGTDGLKIGIVWHTDPGHGNRRRWMPLRHLAPLAELPGVRLISLQKFHGLDQLTALPPSQAIETLGDRFDEGPDAFADAAAVVANLQLVVTIDTSMAHLAGAMGRPVWILLHRSADWRWLTDRDDSPWYPTARLIRQVVADDWGTVGRTVLDRVSSRTRSEAPARP